MNQAQVDSATIKKPALDRLASRQGPLPATFDEYLTQAAATEPALAAADKALRAYKSGGKPPTGDDLVNVSRLLGLYTRLKYRDAVIATLAEMVAIPTVRGARPPHEDPNIVRIGELIGRVATQFGLQYRNVDNRVFEAKLPGTGAEEFGILTHADVVPAVAAEWVLDEGIPLDPFKLTAWAACSTAAARSTTRARSRLSSTP